MPTDLVRNQTPEEIELLRKREELKAVRAELAERELELADLRAQLKNFEGRYLRQVGVLYADLDRWEARFAELEASRSGTADSHNRAEQARKRAEESEEAAAGAALRSNQLPPTPELRNLFREVAKRVHPDFAKDQTDREQRNILMAQANEAYRNGDAETLRRILEDYDPNNESIRGEAVDSELARITLQIAEARKNIEGIEQKIAALHDSEIARLLQNVENAERESRDLLMELAIGLRVRITELRNKCDLIQQQIERNGE